MVTGHLKHCKKLLKLPFTATNKSAIITSMGTVKVNLDKFKATYTKAARTNKDANKIWYNKYFLLFSIFGYYALCRGVTSDFLGFKQVRRAGHAAAAAASKGGGPLLTHLKIDDILDNQVFITALELEIKRQLGQVQYEFENARTAAAQQAAVAPVVAAVPIAAKADLKDKLVERIVAAIEREPIEINLTFDATKARKALAALAALAAIGGSKKRSRTVTIKSDSMPKTVKGLKTRKKLLKKKIRKMNKRIKLNKNRIIKLK